MASTLARCERVWNVPRHLLERSRNSGVDPAGAWLPGQVPPTRRPTILDVARAAGVSKSLVSLALRGEEGVSAASRTRILRVADELGYRSNVWARNLAGRGEDVIGVLITDLGNSYQTDVVLGLEEAAQERSLSVMVAHGMRSTRRLTKQFERQLALGVAAVVVVSSWLPPELMESAARRVPLVVVGRLQVQVPGVDTINNDDAAGARSAVRHLAEAGHERIAHLAASNRPAAVQRRAAYAATMRALGLGEQITVVGPDDVTEGLDNLLRGTARGDGTGPSAIFASNDLAAAQVLDAACDRRLSVPGALAVVGYDNSTLARTVRPRLTSVDQPRAAMGRLALDLLVERLGGRSEERHEVAVPRLIVRGSTMPAGVGAT